MKKRILLILMLTVGITGMACGCDSKSKEVVDYNVGTEEEGSLTGTTGKESEVAQFKDAEHFQFDCETEDGISISVDVPIKVPQYETMSVVEVEHVFYTDEEKERIVKAFFGDSAIYVYDAKNGEAKKDVTSDYSENAFWGTRDGMDFVVNFVHTEYEDNGQMYEHEINGYRFEIYPVNVRDVMPGEIAVCEEGGITYIEGKPGNNECKYTKEEAQKIADNMLKELGVSDYDMIDSANVDWYGGKMVDEYTMETSVELRNGYFFSYALPIDEANSVYAPDVSNGMRYGDICNRLTTLDYRDFQDGGNGLSIAVGDRGVMYVEATWLFDIKKTTQVNLLPLSTIEKIMEERIKGFDDDFLKEKTCYEEMPKTISYNILSLDYHTQYQENSDTYYYVPIWELSRLADDLNIKVNAIDGTVLDN